MSEILCKRLAPIRLVPFFVFLYLLKRQPKSIAKFSWLMFSSEPAHTHALPTYLSIGFGVFLGMVTTPKSTLVMQILA